MEEIQGLPLVAQKSYFASVDAITNPRPRSSCLFSNSLINGLWAPRLPQTPFYGVNNQKRILDYSCYSFSFFLKKKNKKFSFFSLSEKR